VIVPNVRSVSKGITLDGPPNTSECKENVMNGKQSKTFRDYAENCADKAETARMNLLGNASSEWK
jgi:hypothetical protein